MTLILEMTGLPYLLLGIWLGVLVFWRPKIQVHAAFTAGMITSMGLMMNSEPIFIQLSAILIVMGVVAICWPASDKLRIAGGVSVITGAILALYMTIVAESSTLYILGNAFATMGLCAVGVFYGLFRFPPKKG